MGGRNLLDGLEMRTNMLPGKRQSSLLSFVDELVAKGKRGALKGRTFASRSRTKATIQFGVFDNPDPEKRGVDRDVEVEKIPMELIDLRNNLQSRGVFRCSAPLRPS